MKEDAKKILSMVKKGKIDSDKAAELIEALRVKDGTRKTKTKPLASSNSEKMLRVRVKEGETKVNINLPIKFIRSLSGVKGIIPGLEKVEGIDMQQIFEAINNGVEGKIVDIVSEKGETVEVYIE